DVQKAIGRGPITRTQPETLAGIANKFDADQRGCVLEVLTDVAGQQALVHLAIDVLAQARQFLGDVAAAAVQRALARPEGLDLFLGQLAVEVAEGFVSTILDGSHLHVLLDGDALEEATDHVEYLVGTKLLANAL